MMHGQSFAISVEEEFFVVDAASRELRPRAEQLLAAARRQLGERVGLELNLAQIEVATPACTELDELRGYLITLRNGLMGAAERHASRIAATGTHPFSEWLGQQITPDERSAELDETFQLLAWEQLVCACHVHVAVPEELLAVQVVDRTRPWLSVLRALTANSPFSEGVDTGYASYRTQIFERWPTTGLPPLLGSPAGYRRLVDGLVATGVIPDAAKLYWDVGPSPSCDTVTFRVADVCPTVDEAVLLAALLRSLVRTACRAAEAGEAVDDTPDVILRAERWRASRYGLAGELVDPVDHVSRPARDVIDRLLAHLRADLEQHGDWDLVRTGVEKVLVRGNGAERQRRALASGDFTHVVDAIIATTAPSTRW